MKVSIIVPIYNSEQYLKRCLNSLINQTLKDIEIILINDGSSDNSYNICQYYKNIDDRIILINKKNQGVSSARNSGLEVCSGEYICFVDSDDYIELNAIEEMYQIAVKNRADIVLFNHYWGEDNLNVVKFPKNRLIKDRELISILSKSNTNYVLPFSVRNIFKNTKKQKQIKFKTNLKFGEDSLYNLESYLNAKSMYCSEKAYYHYMPNDNSAMSRKNKKKNYLLYLNNLYDEKMKLYEKMKLNDFKIDLYNYTIQHTLNILIDNAMLNRNIKDCINQLKEIRQNKMIIESFQNYNINIYDMQINNMKKKNIKYMELKKYIYVYMCSIYYKKLYTLRPYLSKLKKLFLKKGN